MITENIPVLRYLKDPAQTMNELLQRYPDGGEYGWYAFVFENKTFAWWNHSATPPKWELMDFNYFQNIYFEAINMSTIKDGDTYIWDSEKKIFTITNLKIWDSEQF